jgi:hypothetical protein
VNRGNGYHSEDYFGTDGTKKRTFSWSKGSIDGDAVQLLSVGEWGPGRDADGVVARLKRPESADGAAPYYSVFMFKDTAGVVARDKHQLLPEALRMMRERRAVPMGLQPPAPMTEDLVKKLLPYGADRSNVESAKDAGGASTYAYTNRASYVGVPRVNFATAGYDDKRMHQVGALVGAQPFIGEERVRESPPWDGSQRAKFAMNETGAHIEGRVEFSMRSTAMPHGDTAPELVNHVRVEFREPFVCVWAWPDASADGGFSPKFVFHVTDDDVVRYHKDHT